MSFSSFIIEFPIKLNVIILVILSKRFEAARFIYNAVLGESLIRLKLAKESLLWKQAKKDKKKYFKPSWNKVIVILEGKEVYVNLTDSFCRNCRELRSKKIGQWLIERGHHRWERGKPPKFNLEHIEDNIFKL